MSKWIDYEALKEHIEVVSYEGMWHTTETDLFVSVDNINNAPSIDLVTCAECKYEQQCRKAVEHTTYGPTSITIECKSVNSCSYGSRKE